MTGKWICWFYNLAKSRQFQKQFDPEKLSYLFVEYRRIDRRVPLDFQTAVVYLIPHWQAWALHWSPNKKPSQAHPKLLVLDLLYQSLNVNFLILFSCVLLNFTGSHSIVPMYVDMILSWKTKNRSWRKFIAGVIWISLWFWCFPNRTHSFIVHSNCPEEKKQANYYTGLKHSCAFTYIFRYNRPSAGRIFFWETTSVGFLIIYDFHWRAFIALDLCGTQSMWAVIPAGIYPMFLRSESHAYG